MKIKIKLVKILLTILAMNNLNHVLYSYDEQSVITQPIWNEELDFLQIENMLSIQSIASIISMRDYLKSKNKVINFDNEVYLVTLKNGLKAVFKPSNDCLAEVVAYRASQFLGQRLVPPTVLRTINKMKGSLQFFIEPSIDIPENEGYEEFMRQLDTKDLADIKLFYFIFGQWDINESNQIAQRNGQKLYIALIDNAGLYNLQQAQYGDFAFVRVAYSNERNDNFDIPFSFINNSILREVSLDTFYGAFHEFFSLQRIEAMWDRFNQSGLTYSIWHNSLWIQFYKNHPYIKPNYTDIYYYSTIQSYQRLNRENLEKMWAEDLEIPERRHLIMQLINAILERRDQVLKHMYSFRLQDGYSDEKNIFETDYI